LPICIFSFSGERNNLVSTWDEQVIKFDRGLNFQLYKLKNVILIFTDRIPVFRILNLSFKNSDQNYENSDQNFENIDENFENYGQNSESFDHNS